MDNEDLLLTAFLSFSHALLQVTRERPESVSVTLEPCIRFSGDTWFYESSEASIASARVRTATYNCGVVLSELPGADDFVDEGLRLNLLVLPVGEGGREHRDTLYWMELAELVRASASQYASVDLSDSQLRASLTAWCASKRAPVMTYAVPLTGVEASDAIQIGGWFLRPCDDSWKQHAFGWMMDRSEEHLDRWDAVRARWMLFREVPGEANAQTAKAMRDDAWSIVTSVRLQTGVPVGAPALVALPLHRFGVQTSGQYPLHELRALSSRRWFPKEDRALDPSHVAAITALSTKLTQSREELQFALRRFNLAFQRDAPEDRIVDITIALEATLIGSNESELSYRLALMGAQLLRDHRNSQEVFHALKRLYKVRSTIVHAGKTLDALKKSVALDVPSCIDLAREIMRAFVLLAAEKGTAAKARAHLQDRLVG